MTTYDLAVIGDGVIGLSLAFEAAEAGLRVALCGRPRVGAATPAAGGMLTPGAEASTMEPALIQLASASCALYPDFIRRVQEASGLHCGYREEGTLIVALHRDHVAELEHLATHQQQLGLKSQWLTRTEVREREPNLSPRQVGALWIAGDHQVNPLALQAALRLGAARRGVVFLQCEASPTIAGTTVDILTPGGPEEVRADHVVVAAGAYANDLTGVDLPLRPVRGQYVRLQGPHLVDHVIRTPDVYLVPRTDGEIYVGATQEEVGFEHRVMAGALMDLLCDAWRVVPGTYEMTVVTSGCGFRPAAPDHLPLVGQIAPGRYVATGHFRHGVMLAPITARLLVEAILSGETPALMHPLRPSRFTQEEPRSTP